MYKIEDREPLRKVGDNPNWEDAWEAAYQKFKADVDMPQLESPAEELSWLLNHAVKLEYMDNGNFIKFIFFSYLNIKYCNFSHQTVDEYKQFTAEKVLEMKKPAAPTVTSSNPFDNMNMLSQDFETGVRNLGKKLQIPDHPDHLKILEAAARLINTNLGNNAVHRDPPVGKAYPIKGSEKFLFDDQDLDEAAKILRLLQIQSVRELQTSINETIVAVQEITADPRTDTKLGKVGY